MNPKKSIKYPLSKAITSWQLLVLGALVGVVSALAIVAMRLSFESIQQFFSLGQYDSFEKEGQILRSFAPLLGALVILFIAFISHQKYHRMGVPFVLHRHRKYYGYIPLRNTINQFFSAIAALASGFSVGKEGPAVHLGAGSASYLSQKFNLPHNTTRILTACGIAAGISTTYNIPLAAVVFVLEIVLLRFSIQLFIPVMVASIVGSTISQYFFGDTHVYAHITITDIKLYSIAPLLVLGVIVGTAAALFNRSLIAVMKASSNVSMNLRLPLAGIIVGLIAWFVPHVVGTEHGALSIAFSQQPELSFITMILIGKFIATVCALGLGIPGGVIGVLYALGALLGAVITWSIIPYFPGFAPYASMAIIICMVALMASSLNAPMAALVAILEMSEQASIIFPSLLVVIPAILVAQQVFGVKSLFLEQLDCQNLPYKTSPVYDSLQDTGVLALMRCKFKCIDNASDDSNNYLSIPTFIKSAKQELTFFTSNSNNPIPVLHNNATLADVYQKLAPTQGRYVLIIDNKSKELIGFVTWRSLSKHLHTEFE